RHHPIPHQARHHQLLLLVENSSSAHHSCSGLDHHRLHTLTRSVVSGLSCGPLIYGAIHFGRRSLWLGPHACWRQCPPTHQRRLNCRSDVLPGVSWGSRTGRRSSTMVTLGVGAMSGPATPAAGGRDVGLSAIARVSVTPGWPISSHAAPTTLTKGWAASVPLASSVRGSRGLITMVCAGHNGVVTP